MTQVTPREIQLREVSATELVGYLHRLPGAPGCRKTGRWWQLCLFLKCCSQRVKILQKCKGSAVREGKETLISATISSPPPRLTLPCPGLLPQPKLCSHHLPGLRHALQPLIALWLPSPSFSPSAKGLSLSCSSSFPALLRWLLPPLLSSRQDWH